MKVFLSWSGERSKHVAELLRDWLPDMLQRVEPWLSSVNIAAGKQWHEELARALADVDIGITCLTAENLSSAWLTFEAGAISKRPSGAKVCVFALDVKPSEISGPLSQYQRVTASKDGVLQLVSSLNDSLGDQRLSADRLRHLFQSLWPSLNRGLGRIAPSTKPAPTPESTTLAVP